MSTPALPKPWTPGSLTALPERPAGNVGARTLTRADNDVDAVSGWLLRHQGSPHTFDSYKREAERLLAWCASRAQTLSMLMAEDLVAYQQFLQDPQPRETWCLQSEPRYLAPGVPNPAWQSVRRPTRRLADGSPNPAWPHWLRHTAATHQLDAEIPLLVVRDNLQHASVQTTERYLYVEPDRHCTNGAASKEDWLKLCELMQTLYSIQIDPSLIQL